MTGAPDADAIAAAWVHVARRLGYCHPALVREPRPHRVDWIVIWALGAAFPQRSPVAWAARLGHEPNVAAVMLARARTMRWFSWGLVTEAMAVLIEATP